MDSVAKGFIATGGALLMATCPFLSAAGFGGHIVNCQIAFGVCTAAGVGLISIGVIFHLMKQRQEEMEKEGTAEITEAHGRMNGSGGNKSIFDWHL